MVVILFFGNGDCMSFSGSFASLAKLLVPRLSPISFNIWCRSSWELWSSFEIEAIRFLTV